MDRWALRRLGALCVLALVPTTGAGAEPPGPCVPVPEVDDRCEEWIAVYDGPDAHELYGEDYARAVAFDPSGVTVYVAGSSANGDENSWDVAVVALDASSGARRWAARAESLQGLRNNVAAIAVSPDGARVFVTGAADTDYNTTGDYLTVAYDAATGGHLWTATYDGAGKARDLARALAVSRDGTSVYVTGSSAQPAAPEYNPSSRDDMITVAYDAATGAQRWVASYDSPFGGDQVDLDYGTAVQVSDDGAQVYVAGSSTGAGDPRDYDYDYVVVAYSASDGAPLWTTRYDHARHIDVAAAMALAPSGATLYVTGFSGGAFTLALATDDGATRWQARSGGPQAGPASADDIIVSADGGRVFVTGQSSAAVDGSDWDYATFAYDAVTGAPLWSQTAGTQVSTYESATAIGASPDGVRVYVTGTSGDERGRNQMTVAYDAASGTPQWTARHNSGLAANNFDAGEALAVSASHVVVAGTFNHSIDTEYLLSATARRNSSDIGVLAYPA